MKVFNSIFSHALRVALLFLLAFIWIRYYERNLILAVTYSALVCIALDIILSHFSNKHKLRLNLKSEEIKHAQSIAKHFSFSPDSTAVSFFHGLISKIIPAQKKSSFIFWIANNQTTVFVPYYHFDSLKISDLFSIYSSIKLSPKPQKIIVACTSAHPDTIQFAQSAPINFVILDQFATYEKLLKPQNCFPKVTQSTKPSPKATWHNILAYALSRKRAKSWLFSSFILIFSSFFVRVSVLYLIVSSIMLLLAIFAYGNNRFNTPNSENILD